MTHPMYTENIGMEIELLITTIEEMENEKKHIDILSDRKKTKNELEIVESAAVNGNSGHTLDNTAMDLLTDAFDNLKQQQNSDQSSCCSGNKENNCCGNNYSPIENMNTSPADDKCCNETNAEINNINENISRELERMQGVIADRMSKIMDHFDDDLKNKILQQFS